jgi:hypothetical protein
LFGWLGIVFGSVNDKFAGCVCGKTTLIAHKAALTFVSLPYMVGYTASMVEDLAATRNGAGKSRFTKCERMTDQFIVA